MVLHDFIRSHGNNRPGQNRGRFDWLGKWYYMNSSGAMTTGWQQIGGKWYYMNSSGAMTTGWQQIGGKWYYMNSSRSYDDRLAADRR